MRIFEGHSDSVFCVCISEDGRWVLSGSRDNTLRLWELDWELEAVDPVDWDDDARPYLENFLSCRVPVTKKPVADGYPQAETIVRQISRGKPSLANIRRVLGCLLPHHQDWNEEGFQRLLYTLGCAGHGWLQPEGVMRKLEEMAADWTGPPFPKG